MFGVLWLSVGLTPGVVQPSFAETREQLRAAAIASVRPEECQEHDGSLKSSLWRPAQARTRAAYCNALSRGYARLSAAPASALAEAAHAERVLRKRPATQLLRAMALLEAGRLQEAWKVFEKVAAAEHPLAPVQQHDFARAAWRLGHPALAAQAYRQLVPMRALLPERRQQSLHLEAGLLAMSTGKVTDLALGYLSEAKGLVRVPAEQAILGGALALALDRGSEPQAARGVARESAALWPLIELLDALETSHSDEGTAGATAPMLIAQSSASAGIVVDVHELYAMVAVLAHDDRSVALDYWQEYLERIASDHAWRHHALSRKNALSQRQSR